MRTIDAIVFDKDGTLFDFHATWGAWAMSFLHDIAEGDLATMVLAGDAIGYDVVKGQYLPASAVIAGTPLEIASLLQPLFPHFSIGDLVQVMNGMAVAVTQVPAVNLPQCLTELSATGRPLGVVTNDAEDPAKAHLAATGIDAYFAFVAGYDSGFGSKPNPGPLLAFANAVNVPAENCVMVGDSRHDLQAGRAAGMATVGVLTGIAEEPDLRDLADVVFPDIGHLQAWLERA